MKDMTRVISFSGKGGTGKTTGCSLFLHAVRELGLAKQILVIDADPDANLATTLSVHFDTTIGDAMDHRKKALDDGVMGEKFRADIYDAVFHGEFFDFIVMGRKRGQGCYCAINEMLNSVMAETMNMYDLVLIDFDAGLEHFSRGTGSTSDVLVTVCDESRLSFETAQRISEIVEELRLPYSYRYVLGSRYHEENKDILKEFAKEIDMELLGFIDYDKDIAALNFKGLPLAQLPADCAALENARRMVKYIFDNK